MLRINLVHQGFSQNLIPKIEPESIALSFWSPPYFVGKEYEKEETYETWQLMLEQVIKAHYDTLKPGGFMVINIADILCFKDESIPKFQAMNLTHQKSLVTKDMVVDAKEKNPNFTRYQLAEYLGCSEQTIDRRLNGNNIRGGKYQTQTRVKLVGGNLEKYAYDCGLYLYDKRVWVKDPSWANSRWTSTSLKAVSEYEDIYVFWKPGQQIIDRTKLESNEWKEWGSRGIWFIDSVRRNDDHVAKFPLALAQRVIKLFSEKDDIVLDPFMGSGTTAIAALSTGRNFIGLEKEMKYVDLANKNITEFLKQKKLNF
jgi:site-specific DNA-methyltransferase (adenine-specific)